MPIIANQQTTNRDKLHDIVTGIIKDAINLAVEEPYTIENIVHRMYGHSCKGLYPQIHTVEVVADMLALKVRVIAKNRRNIVVALIRTIESDGPTRTINWHTEMVKQIRLGGSEFTVMLNRMCRRCYTQQGEGNCVEKKEVCEIPPHIPNKKRKDCNTAYKRGSYKKRKNV
jgi:hypothetical protein